MCADLNHFRSGGDVPAGRLHRFVVLLAVLVASAAGASVATAQATVPVTFRFIPDLTTSPGPTVVRSFLPGSFNGWGMPYGPQGQILPSDESEMTYDADLDEWRYTQPLATGQYSYKIQYQTNPSGSEYVWLADPLVTEVIGPNDDSVVRVTDPMAFQLARERDANGQVFAVSAGIYGTQAVTSVTFTVNETTYTTSIADTDTGDGVYRLVLPQPVPVGSLVRVEATDAAGRTASAQAGAIPPTVTDAPVPEGLQDGITYNPTDPTRAWIVLRAPTNQYVAVRGDFNNWQISDDDLLARDASAPLGTRWWIELTGLTPGTEVAFQYLVDGTIEVTDPYAARVLFPGQPGFPTGRSNHAVGILTPGATPYEWQNDDFQAPATDDLVVYELLVGDFLTDGRFEVLADTLDYLVRLGVNAIELMPISQRVDTESWGYDPAFHLAVENRYGTPDQFKAFVDAAHGAGLAVLLDVVYNQTKSESPLVRLDNTGELGPPTPTNPWANVTATHDFSPYNDINHESPLTQLWLDRANQWWLDEYHIDGYRFDLTSGFMQTGPFYEYNQSRVDLLTRMIGQIREVHPQTIIILEHFTPIDEVRAVTQFGEDRGWPSSLSWHNMGEPYRLAASGKATDPLSSLRASYSPYWGIGLPVRNGITYMESHDEQWMVWENRNRGASSGDYNIRTLDTALNRQKLAASFFFTVPGPRMMWQFGEAGYGGGPGECLIGSSEPYPANCTRGVPNRIASKPVRWDYVSAGAPPSPGAYTGTTPLTPASDAERRSRLRLHRTFASLIGLRNDYAIFRSPATTVGGNLESTQVRTLTLQLADAPDGEPRQAIVFGNFGVTAATISFPFPNATTWYDFFGDEQINLPAGGRTLDLAPGEFHIWTDVDIPSPEGGLITAGEDAPDGATASALRAVFPNPTASRATVRFELAAPGRATVEVFDALGRTVATLADGVLGAGPHDLAFDASSLPAGVYAVRLATDAGTETIRLTVTR